MAHGHDHAPSAGQGKVFALGVALNVAAVLIEAVYGFWTNSLALLADAGHNLSDVLGLLLAWGGYALSQIPPSERRTYGWRGSSILAALFNALILLVAVGGIAWEAIQRFSSPEEPAAMTIVVVAGIGVVINTLAALLFLRGRERDINIRGAFLHMAADAGISVGVVFAGLLIRWTGWAWIDPATSLAISVLVLLGTWGLLKASINLAMHAVPEEIDPGAVREYLSAQAGVTEVHDLHIWAMSTTEVALTVHLVKPDVDDEDPFLARIAKELHDRFGIEHSTIQIERDAERASCGQVSPDSL